MQVASLGAHAASTAVTIGAGRIFVINADQDIAISFGAAATIIAPDGTYYRIPANQQTTFDMGSANDTIKVYNLSATTAANVYIMRLSVM
jgi:hypothetical protein